MVRHFGAAPFERGNAASERPRERVHAAMALARHLLRIRHGEAAAPAGGEPDEDAAQPQVHRRADRYAIKRHIV